MNDNASISSENPPLHSGTQWVASLPDGAVSVDADSRNLILRASKSLQCRFDELLGKKKSGLLSPAEAREYAAMTELDEALSWLNRLSRQARR